MNKGNDNGEQEKLFLWCDSRQWDNASSLSSLHDRIRTHTVGPLWTSDQLDAETFT
jgi:hypothetical protein